VGVLSAAWVDVVEEKELKWPVIISLPKTCGPAVVRNRFRRMSRSYFTDLSQRDEWALTRKVLWIRLDRRYRLQKRIVLAEWKPLFEKMYTRLQLPHTPKTFRDSSKDTSILS
jgi:ribonuclease P protein component